MNNINYVSTYLIEKGFESLHLIRTTDGKLYFQDKNNNVFIGSIYFLPIQLILKKLSQIHL